MSWKAGYHSSWVGSGRYPVRVFSAVTGTAATTSGRGQMQPMVRVGRTHWRSHRMLQMLILANGDWGMKMKTEAD